MLTNWFGTFCFLFLELVFSVEGSNSPELDPCFQKPGVVDAMSCDSPHIDDSANEFTELEDEPDDFLLKVRRRRSAIVKEALEANFTFTDDKKYFYDLLPGSGKHDKKLFHKQAPQGYAESDRTKLLLLEIQKSAYPPFTYRGIYGRSTWHKIPIQNLMKKRNWSFMMLEHKCEQEDSRDDEKQCIREEFGKLPRCESEDQSPMNIDTERARDSSLKEFEYTGLKDENGSFVSFPFMMSLPWDGTDVLTVELLGDNPLPGVKKGSISGKKLHLERIHIHYGENETVGSEHTLDNKTYSMEIQFVFTKREDPDGKRTPKDPQYWDLLMEYYTPDGKDNRHKNVHIIALWIKVIEDDQLKAGTHNRTNDWNDEWSQNARKAFASLGKAARKFWSIHNVLRSSKTKLDSADNKAGSADDDDESAKDSKSSADDKDKSSNDTKDSKLFKYRAVLSTGDEGLKVGAFFPPQVYADKAKTRDSIYYNYKGSITHPPCFSYVDWAIYDRPLYIPTSMWQNFLYIHSEFDDTNYIAGNYRLPRHIYVKALDSHRARTWTAEMEAERRRTLSKIARRDLRRSKPSRDDWDNYDYYDVKEDSGIRLFPTWLSLVSTILSKMRT